MLAFWKWLKAQPVPAVEQDGFDVVWEQIAGSMRDCLDQNGGDLLTYLLNAGMDYINDDWKTRRKAHDQQA